MTLILAFVPLAVAQKNIKLPLVNDDDDTTPIKLVVSSENVYYEDGAGLEPPVAPFTVFWQLDDKDQPPGYYTCGFSDGTKIGRIKEEFVTLWKTKFGYRPGTSFEIKRTDGSVYKVILEKPDQPNASEYAFITDNPFMSKLNLEYKNKTKDEGYRKRKQELETKEASLALNVVACSYQKQVGGKVDSLAGKMNPETGSLKNASFNFVYVVDSTRSMEPLIQMAQKVADQTAQELNRVANIDKNKIRFGIVEYRDDVPGLEFVTKITCPLTENFSEFQNALGKLQCATEGSADVEEEVFMGIDEAVKHVNDVTTKSGNENNCLKFIILLGDAPGKGKGESIEGKSGLSMEDVLGKLYQYKHHSGNAAVRNPEAKAVNPQGSFRVFAVTHENPTYATGSQEAAQQFKKLTGNQDARNFYVNSTDSLERAVNGLNKVFAVEIKQAIAVSTAVATGDSRPLRNLTPETGGALGLDFSIRKPIVGTAVARTSQGENVADKEVFVMLYELQRYKSALSFFLTTISANKSNPEALVDTLKKGIGAFGSGSNIGPTVALDKMVENFPLRLKVLDITPISIKAMSDSTFNQLCNDIQAVVDRLDKYEHEYGWAKFEYPLAIQEMMRTMRLGEGYIKYRFINQNEFDLKNEVKDNAIRQ